MLPSPLYTIWSFISNYAQSPLIALTSPPASSLTFTLRHIHAVTNTSSVIFSDVPQTYSTLSTHSLSTRPTTVHRPRSQEAFHRARLRSIRDGQSEKLDWDEDDVLGPDVTDRETLRELAKMTNNAYLDVGEAGWYNLTDTWRNVSQ